MKPITVGQIALATGGSLVWGDEGNEVTDVEIDSRKVKPGDLFVPIIGANVDAHTFIPDVLEMGAGCVLSSDPAVTGQVGACVLVEDTVAALQKLAAWYRSQFSIPVIGVTGSVGKTSTKEMIGAVLEKKFNTLVTYKNLNSQVGLPLMAFKLEDSTEIAVFEMGISMPGEMDRLVDIAAPDVAVLTNIGVSHIGNLGSREGICREKGRIIRKFGEDGKLFACADHDLYEMVRKNIPFECCEGNCHLQFYGIRDSFSGDDAQLTYAAEDIHISDDGAGFTFVTKDKRIPVQLSVMGEHNVANAVVAIAIGLNFGVSPEHAAEAVGTYKPLDMRGVIREAGGAYIIDDTYNASPDSIRSNLKALFMHPGNGRRIAVLGDVLELGEQSAELHRSIGAFIENEAEEGRRLDGLFTVGKETETTAEFVRENTDIPVSVCKDNFELIHSLKSEIRKEDWILIKGSRGMHLDEVAQALIKELPLRISSEGGKTDRFSAKPCPAVAGNGQKELE